MRTRIMIVKDKHNTDYYDVTTDEQWAAACVTLLASRLDYYIHKPEDPRERMTESWSTLKPEHFEWAEKTVPEGLDANMAKELTDRINKAKSVVGRVMNDYEDALTEYNEVKRIVDENDRSMCTVGSGKWERQEPVAWQIIYQRSDYEYEGVQIEYPTDATAGA